MNKLVPVFIILILTCTSCGLHEMSADLEDVSSREVIVIRKDVCQEHIHRLEIRVAGELDGKGELSLILNRKPYVTLELSGKFDIKMYEGDWYSDTARIVYEPDGVTKGTVKLIYQFFD